MTTSPRSTAVTTTQPPTLTQAVIILLLTIADTTWRAFVPTIGGLFLGLGLDSLTGKAPLFTIILIIAGFATAVLLLALQIRRVNRSRNAR